jgi:predicted RNase H-like HicB family nuclease
VERIPMKIPVLVQSENGNGFRAEVLPGQALVAQAATPEDAIEKLRKAIQARIDQGAWIAYLEFAEPPNPWLRLIGAYKGDPYLDEYKKAVADYRKQVDEDPDRL